MNLPEADPPNVNFFLPFQGGHDVVAERDRVRHSGRAHDAGDDLVTE